ncbi:alkK [Scenedesmus sp. PABB004]|nr:alkK [Scenedesmus sp. PABB004]
MATAPGSEALSLPSLIANKPLLAALSREYELLKSSAADVDYDQWIIRRLRAAASTQTGAQGQTPPPAEAPARGPASPPPPPRQPQPRQPQWVAAARLQGALRDSGQAVPARQAASERPRRLAASTADARAQLALGLRPPPPPPPALGAPPAEQAQLQQVMALTQRVVAQNELLQEAVQQANAQLQRHEGLLSGAGAAPPRPDAAPLQQLPDAVQSSWLVRAALTPAAAGAGGGSQAPGPAPPEFIRIAGAGTPRKKQQPAQPRAPPQEQAADRRARIKAALRHLLAGGGAGGGAPQQAAAAGLLQALLGGQPQQQEAALADLQAALVGAGSSSGGAPPRPGAARRGSQDENAPPPTLDAPGWEQTSPQPRGGSARQVLLERTQQRQRQRLQQEVAAVAAAAPTKPAGPQPQQQAREPVPQRPRPEWQSEPFVPPPAHLMRRKRSGLAEAWDIAAAAAPRRAAGAPRPGTAGAGVSRPGRPRPGGVRPAPGRAQGRASGGGGPRARSQPRRAQQQPWAAGRASGAAPRGPAGWADAQRPLEDEARFSRLEETASHILGVLGRLEQQLEGGPPPAAGAGAARAPGAAPPAEAAQLLSALDRMEAAEREIHSRWFGGDGERSVGGGGERGDGGGGGGDADGAGSPAPGAAPGAGAAPPASPRPWEPAVARAASSVAALLAPPSPARAAPAPAPAEGEWLSRAALKSIKAGRRRFLRHQARVDGALELLDGAGGGGSAGASPEPGGGDGGGAAPAAAAARARRALQPTFVVEAVADLLLDELLAAAAAELEGACEELCEEMVEEERCRRRRRPSARAAMGRASTAAMDADDDGGRMQDWPLVVTAVLEYAERWHSSTEIVCRTVEGPTVISNYGDLGRRARLAALALRALGVRHGDVVGTLAWNTTRHLEAWYGIMGIGAVCHTLNPRLSDEDIRYIADHGQDKVILADVTFLPVLARIAGSLPRLEAVVLLTDRQHMPAPGGPGLPRRLLCYEELLDGAAHALAGFAWPRLDENAPAGLCYTSGTTGRPKGVRYSHRSNFLHAFVVTQPDALALSATSSMLMIVPMFHANSWGLSFAAPMVGARLVLPGPALDGAAIHQLINTHRVDLTAAVPTVLLGLLQHAEAHGTGLGGALRRIIIGGAAPPRAMIEAIERHGVAVSHMWGMTELSPLGSLGAPTGPQAAAGMTREESVDRKVGQGRPHVLCDMRIVGPDGAELPRDGAAVGSLQVRGPIVVQRYHRHASPAVDPGAGRWFDTGDVASIDACGGMRITDRSKDVIKSGGEWISSIALENAAMACPGVLEAAVIALPDERYGERPLLVVVPKPGAAPDDDARLALRRSVLDFMRAKPSVAKFAVPDDVALVPALPYTATGKVSKVTLRRLFAGFVPRPPSKL